MRFEVNGAFNKLKKTPEMFWSGRPDLNRGPPASKPAGLSLGSPSFSIAFLKTKELARNLVVALCTIAWLRMHGVPSVFPSAKMRRNFSSVFPPLSRNQTLRFGDAKVRVQALGELWPGEY